MWTFERWSELFKAPPPPTESVHIQRRWDAAAVAEGIACLRETLDNPRGCARLLAVSAEYDSEWLTGSGATRGVLGGARAPPDLFQVDPANFANPLSFYFDHRGYPLVFAGAGSWINL